MRAYFQHFNKAHKYLTSSTASRMYYGVISVRHQSPLCTLTLVTRSFAKLVRRNISQINPKNTT